MATKAKPKTAKTVKPPDDGLTDKQRLFISFYLELLNATQAARLAGYEGDYATLRSIGSENLTKPNISAEIGKRLRERAMSADEVLARLKEQASADQSEFYESDGRNGAFVNLEKLVEAGKGHLIKSINRDGKTGRITKVEFYDSQSALELLGRHHKLFTDKVEHGGKVQHEHDHSGTVTFQEARELAPDELAGRVRAALGEVAETTRRW